MYEKKKERHLVSSVFEHGKIPPSSIELEEAVLGSIIMDSSCIFKIINIIKPEIFYREANQQICKVILEMNDKNIPIDILSVTNELRSAGVIEEVGGPYHITELVGRISATVNVEYYCRIVYQKYIQREIIRLSAEHLHDAFEDTTDVFDLYNEVMSSFENIEISIQQEQAIDIHKSLEFAISQVFEANEGKSVNIYETNNIQFDNLVGLEPNNIMLVGGKSGTGKTRFTLYLLSCLLETYKDQMAILWYTMEDPVDKIVRCFLSQYVHLSDKQLKSKHHKISQDKLDMIVAVKDQLNNYDIEFFDRPAKIKNIGNHFVGFCAKRKDKFCILVIDNLMLLEDNNSFKNQTEADDYVARSIKNFQLKTKNLVIMLHHFTDEQLQKTNLKDGYRPRESNLKGSTRIRDISTIIALLNKPSEYPDLMAEYKDKEEIMKYLFLTDIAKNRNGNTGVIRWFGNLDYNIFEEIK